MKTQNTLKLITLIFSLALFSCNNDNNEPTIVNEGQIRLISHFFTVQSDLSTNNAFVIPPSNDGVRNAYIAFTNGEIYIENDIVKYSNDVTVLVEFNLKSSNSSVDYLENDTYDLPTSNGFDFSQAYLESYTIYADMEIENGVIIPDTGIFYDSETANPSPSYGEIVISSAAELYDIDYTLNFSTLPQYQEFPGYYNGTLIEL